MSSERFDGSRERSLSVLVTGAGGFFGRHLGPALQTAGITVIRLLRSNSRHSGPSSDTYFADLLDAGAVAEVVADVQPDRVIHLAALSSPARSRLHPQAAFDVNVKGTINLLESLRTLRRPPRLLALSSSYVYGTPGADSEVEALTEETPLRPLTPYGASKAAQELAVRAYAVSYGIPALIVRPFNLLGPGQPDEYAASSFARQIAERELGVSKGPILVGNLDVERDFLDVRDAAQALALVLEKGRPGSTYNLASGKPVSLRAILEGLMAHSSATINFRIDPERVRPDESPRLFGAIDRLKSDTGWQPRIPIENTLGDLLTYWRERLGGAV